MPAQYHAALNPIADIAAGMPPKPWKETLMSAISYHAANVDGLKIFYREAGRRDAPTLLLLHGFPTSSHMFATLSLCLPIASMSWRRTYLGSDSPICRRATRFLTHSPSSPR